MQTESMDSQRRYTTIVLGETITLASVNTEPDPPLSSDAPDCECGHPPSNHGDRVFSGWQCFTEAGTLARVFGTLTTQFGYTAAGDMSCECPGYTPGKILES